MKMAIFGDSWAAGDHGEDTFVTYLKEYAMYSHTKAVFSYAVSGTTIGNYSLFPTDQDSLWSILTRPEVSKMLHTFDVICLEYGINDACAIACGNVTEAQVVIAFRKCIDYIKQINHEARIVFLCNEDMCTLKEVDEGAVRYLGMYYSDNELLRCYPGQVKDIYINLANHFSKYAERMYMLWFEDNKDHNILQQDKIHPNEKGHRIIADRVKPLFDPQF